MMQSRPEHELLVACARRSVGGDDLPDVRALLAEVLDWELVLKTAGYHQIVPLLDQTLRVDGRQSVPQEHLDSLQRRLDTNATRVRRLAEELVHILELAHRAGVALIPFKGPVLAMEMYGSLTLRQFDDLDLLIAPADFARGEELLIELGYRCRKDFGYEAKYIHPEHGSCIDLHRALSSRALPAPLAFNRLWARRTKISLGGYLVETLSVEDLLIVLCLQAARDAWQGRTRLAKICDIGQVLRQPRHLAWARVTEEMRLLRIKRIVDFGLQLAVQVLDLSPADVPKSWRHYRAVSALVQQERKALFDDRTNPATSRIRGARMYFHLRERWPDKLRPYWWLHVVPWLRPWLRPIRDYGRSLLGKRGR